MTHQQPPAARLKAALAPDKEDIDRRLSKAATMGELRLAYSAPITIATSLVCNLSLNREGAAAYLRSHWTQIANI